MFWYIMNLANGMNQNMQLWDSENPWRATLKPHTNIVFKRNDLPINITTPWRIFFEGIYGYKSKCTKISEFLDRNKDPYKAREIRMKRETERNKGIPYKHMCIFMSFYYECIYTCDIMRSPPEVLELKYPLKTDMIYLVLLAILSPLC